MIGAVLIGCIVIFLVGRGIGVFRFTPSTQEDVVKMIEVAGMSEAQARQELTGLGLEVSVVYEKSADVPEGQVIGANIREGTQLLAGDQVELTVSGTSGVEIPDVKNKSLAEAVSELEAEGFVPEKNEGFSDTVVKGNVMAQNPEAGTSAERGSVVTITISQGAQESKVPVPDVMGMFPEDAETTLKAAGVNVGTVEEVNNDNEALVGKVCYQSYSVGTEVEPGTSVDLHVSIGPKVTYMYMANIESPALEDPAYVQGTPCLIVLTTAGGRELYRMTTASFPTPVNLLDLNEATGTLTLIYNVTSQSSTVVNPETGETTTVPGTVEEKSISRPVEFSRKE